MIFAMRWIVSGAFVLVLAGCDRPQEVIDQQACTILCDCLGDPGQQDECIEICVSELGPIGPACQECVGENADRCSALESECEAPCIGPQPDPDPVPSASGGVSE